MKLNVPFTSRTLRDVSISLDVSSRLLSGASGQNPVVQNEVYGSMVVAVRRLNELINEGSVK